MAQMQACRAPHSIDALFCALLRSAMPEGTHASAEYREMASRLVGQGVPMNNVRSITEIVDNIGA